jgi:hypothetical protein
VRCFRDDGFSLLGKRLVVLSSSSDASFSSENKKNNENDVRDDESEGESFIELSEEKRNTASAVGGKDEDEKENF